MSDLIFNPDKNNFRNKSYNQNQETPKSKLAEWLIKISGGKIDEQKANYLMLGILGIIIFITIVILYSTFGGERNSVLKVPKTDQNYTE